MNKSFSMSDLNAGSPIKVEDAEIPTRMVQLTEMITSLGIVIEQLQKKLELVSSIPEIMPPSEAKKDMSNSPLGACLLDQIMEIEKLKQRIHIIINLLQI